MPRTGAPGLAHRSLAKKDRTTAAAGRPAGRGRKFSKEVLAPLVAEGATFSEVCRRLGAPAKGGALALVSRYSKEYGLDLAHMRGRGHGTGVWNERTLDEVLAAGRACREHPARLREARLASGSAYERFGGGNQGEWLGKLLALEIDHASGDETDSRRENLRFARPNCHRQTDTWGRV